MRTAEMRKRAQRGVCRIQKRCPAENAGGRRSGNECFKTVGCGCLVKLEIPKQAYAIITADKVFQGDFDIQNYRVDLKKSNSEPKTFELRELAFRGKILKEPHFGLTVIPLDQHSSVFPHLYGPIKKRCSVFKRSFLKAEFSYGYVSGLDCYMVAADETDPSGDGQSFSVTHHELTRDSRNYSHYYLSESDFPPCRRFKLGAAILQRADNNWSFVGVLSSSSSAAFQARPLWLTKTKLNNLRSVGRKKRAENPEPRGETHHVLVDAGVHTKESQVNTRLSTNVTSIPLKVRSDACLKLNVKRSVRFDDFRMLAEKVGLSRDETDVIEQNFPNPTDEILKTWSTKSREATVGKLIELLQEDGFERIDVAEILEDWVFNT